MHYNQYPEPHNSETLENIKQIYDLEMPDIVTLVGDNLTEINPKINSRQTNNDSIIAESINEFYNKISNAINNT